MTKKDEQRLIIVERNLPNRTCERYRWRKRHNIGQYELHPKPNTVNIIQSSRMRWADHFVLIDDKELHSQTLRTNPGSQRRRGRPKSRWIEGGTGRR